MEDVKFNTIQDANTFMSQCIDKPEKENEHILSSNIKIHIQSHLFQDDKFTNSYDLAYTESNKTSFIDIYQTPQSIINIVEKNDLAVVSGGFFLLNDDDTSVRQSSLNLAMKNKEIYSMPTCDRETVIIRNGCISPRYLKAMGILCLNNTPYRWLGSKTNHSGEAIVFSNGNLAVDHIPDKNTVARRVIRESSKYTPISEVDYADIGLIKYSSNEFYVNNMTRGGGLDITNYDFVLRTKYHQARKTDLVKIESIDDLVIDEIDGAFSAGPMITDSNFNNHSINRDESLGSHPPFSDRRMARLVLYLTSDNSVHFRLFDSRPNSETFQGVTPKEACDIINQEEDVVSGIFLDPGQTAKIYVSAKDFGITYGNRHYLKWPKPDDDKFIWTPDQGRPIANMIRIQEK